MTSSQKVIRVGQTAIDAQHTFALHFEDWLNGHRFELTEQREQALTYTRKRLHAWQIVVAVLLFPVGLLALAAQRQEERVFVTFRDEEDEEYEADDEDASAATITIGLSMRDGRTYQDLQFRLGRFDPEASEGGG